MLQGFSPAARAARIARWISARPWIATIAFALLSAFLVAWTNYYAGRADRWVDRDVYNRVSFWIASSECAARTGIILGYCLPDGKVAAIEDVSIADDRGHTIVANAYAMFTGRAITLRGLVVANIVINAAALFAIAATLFLCGWKLSALFLLMVPRYVVPGPLPSADGYATHMAAFLFALVAAVLVAHVPLRKSERAAIHWLAIVALAGACLAWSMLLRQPYGQGGFLVVASLLAFRWFRGVQRGKTLWREAAIWRTGVILAALGLATLYSTSALFALRGILQDVPRSGHAIESHGISHNLYMGLGVPGNPWGIKWDDGAALAHIGEAGRIRYGSDDHYRSLRNSYVRIVMTEPLQVARIYAQKLVDSLFEISQSSRPERKVTLAVLAFVLLIAVLARSRSRPTPEELGMLVAVWGSLAVVLLQGVLAMPAHLFISPGKYAAICGFAILSECVARRVLRDPERDIASTPSAGAGSRVVRPL